MRHTAFVRLKLLWLTVTYLTCADGVHSATLDELIIQKSTLKIHSDSTLSFRFEGPSVPAERFQVESTVSLDSGGAWTVEPQAVISELLERSYSVVLPLNRERTASYFRISMTRVPPAALFINEVMSDNAGAIADGAGDYWDWIEIFNPNDAAVDLTGYGLSDDASRLHRWTFPSVTIQPGGFVMVFASGEDRAAATGDLHANFRLNAGGERLFLTAPDTAAVDQVDIPALQSNQSFGRLPNGGENWHLYPRADTTPGKENVVTTAGEFIQPPRFSLEEHFFAKDSIQKLELISAVPGQIVRYTTNGSPVSSTSEVYSGPIVLDRTIVVRAAAFDGVQPSPEITGTFFFGADHNLPIVSIAAQPSHFEFRSGFLYGLGGSVLSQSGQVLQNFPFTGSNAWQDREVPVSLEFYEPTRELGFQLRAGLKIFGGWGSRGYPQKSFALFARQKYGAGKINHRIFPDKPIDGFESLVLRNSGNDNQSTHQTPPRPPINQFATPVSYGSYFVNSSFTLMRDAMMQRLIKDVGLDTQAYRPAVVYLNGEYWGIYNIREKINEHYVIANHGIEKGQIDLIEGYGMARAGDNKTYNAMRNYVATRDLASPGNYAFVEENYLDIDNFIDYHLAVIYFQNFDIGNIKCWRPRAPGGRFRWVVYDQDYGFNLWKPEVYLASMARDYADYDNMFDFYTAGSGTEGGWPNAGGRTLLLRRLLMNDGFKERFIKRCADLLNGPFREDLVAGTIQEMAAVIRPEIARHLQRWSWAELQKRGFGAPHKVEYDPFVQETWEKNIRVLIDFAKERPAKLRQDCISHFKLRNGLGEITVNVLPAGAGRARFNTLTLADFPWSGVWFNEYPLGLTAIPKPGYRFAGWASGDATSDQPRWERTITSSTASLEARFEPLALTTPSAPPVFVTEIQYHPASSQDSGDWFELHNPGAEPIDIEGWILRDGNDDREFLIPDITVPPGGYVVICQNADKFRRHYPNVSNSVGSFTFGLGNGGDTIRLFDPTGMPILNLQYDDQAPWPAEADGTGRTLQLINLKSYSTNPDAWTVSPGDGGTPGSS